MHDPYSVTDIYEALAGRVLPLKPSELLVALKDQAGMSSATFWRLWKVAKDHPAVIVGPPPTGRVSWDKKFSVPAREVIHKSGEWKSKRGKKTPARSAARSMPPLYHKSPNTQFSYDSSEALDWLLSQPEIKEALWMKYRD